MTLAVVGAVLGLAGGTGLALAALRLPALRRRRLADRVTPYLADRVQQPRPLEEPAGTPFPTLERLLRPSIRAGARALERGLGGGPGVARRLSQSGSGLTVEQFRVEQLIWGGLGLLAGVVAALALEAGRRVQAPAALAVLCLLAALSGVLLRDQMLTAAVRSRAERMLAEFPTIAELFALSVTAGEGAVGALERVTRVGSGELARELRATLSEVRAGAPLTQALDALASRTALPALVRFVDGILVAIERGTPLGDVLRAQAGDVRDASKRSLIETGGRREIAMMVPVVFLIMPITVVFALFPGYYGLAFTSP